MMTPKRLIATWLARWSTLVTSKSTVASPPPGPTIDSARKARADAGEYRLLYKYLRDRYASRVVLTFSEIEDLLGFSLPERARLQQEWWSVTDPVPHESAQSDAWIVASRTATVNLAAQNVVFEHHAMHYAV
jgi:hypothetical protein